MNKTSELNLIVVRMTTTALQLQQVINDAATEPGERIILNKSLAKLYDAAKAIEYVADRDNFSQPNKNTPNEQISNSRNQG